MKLKIDREPEGMTRLWASDTPPEEQQSVFILDDELPYVIDRLCEIMSPIRHYGDSPSQTIRRLKSYCKIAIDIINGLEGVETFRWSSGEWEAYAKKARQMGVTLVTKTGITKRGYRLKRGATPVGNVYFRAPIKRYADVYVLECQAVKRKGEFV